MAPNTTAINAQGPAGFTVEYAEARAQEPNAIALDYLAAATTGRALTNGVVQPTAGRGGRGEARAGLRGADFRRATGSRAVSAPTSVRARAVRPPCGGAGAFSDFK